MVVRASRVRIACAASAMISGLRIRSIWLAAPGIIAIAAVAITERGHSALTAMPSPRNSSAMPSTHMLIPYFAIV